VTAHSHVVEAPNEALGLGGETNFTCFDLTLADVKGRSIVIHAGDDNYFDQPAPLGGGGARIACGVAKAEPLQTSYGTDLYRTIFGDVGGNVLQREGQSQ
jgi:hypothetical protein